MSSGGEKIDLVEAAELAIQKILLDLWNEHGISVENVEVDTRNFANMAVEITFQ